jgi:hypothetical protein
MNSWEIISDKERIEYCADILLGIKEVKNMSDTAKKFISSRSFLLVLSDPLHGAKRSWSAAESSSSRSYDNGLDC